MNEMEYSNEEKALKAMYEELSFETNAICEGCKIKSKNNGKNLSSPMTAWVVGKNFSATEHKVLFVGKTARGDSKGKNNFDVSRTTYWNKHWPYWSYTKAICSTIYHSPDIENIAMTNLVKCNFSRTVDSTTPLMKENCTQKLKVFRREIEIIQPKKIVFYTSGGYYDVIEEGFDSYEIISEKTNENAVPIGKKKMNYIDAIATINGNEVKVLLVGHPERKNKDEFVNIVSEWITSGVLSDIDNT